MAIIVFGGEYYNFSNNFKAEAINYYYYPYRISSANARSHLAHDFWMSRPTTFEAVELYINRIYTQFCSATISLSRAID